MPSRNLDDLHPEVKLMVTAWLATAAREGLEVLVTCTYRSQAEQDALYAQGRTKPGAVVTWAKRSNHSHTEGGRPASLAVDFVPLKGGKTVWTATDPAWARLGRLAKAQGLVWGGDWPLRKRDLPHLEHPNAKAMMEKPA